jgi:hypothetical protein
MTTQETVDELWKALRSIREILEAQQERIGTLLNILQAINRRMGEKQATADIMALGAALTANPPAPPAAPVDFAERLVERDPTLWIKNRGPSMIGKRWRDCPPTYLKAMMSQKAFVARISATEKASGKLTPDEADKKIHFANKDIADLERVLGLLSPVAVASPPPANGVKDDLPF